MTHDALCFCIECLPWPKESDTMTATRKMSEAETEANCRTARDWRAGGRREDFPWLEVYDRHLIDVQCEASTYQTDAERSGLVFTDEQEGE